MTATFITLSTRHVCFYAELYLDKYSLLQIKDYASRKGLQKTDIEKLLACNLAYEP